MKVNNFRSFFARHCVWVSAVGFAMLVTASQAEQISDDGDAVYSASTITDIEDSSSPALIGLVALGGGEGAGDDRDVDNVDEVDVADFSSGLASAPTTAMAGMVGGYIDPAVIATRVRVRYDKMENASGPTRAEFFYPTVNALGGPGPAGVGGGGGAGGLGPAGIDMEEFTTYIEWALAPRLSIFGDFSIRSVGPLAFGGAAGFIDGTQVGAGDSKFGFRYGIIADCNTALTFQTRVTTPTGEPLRGLGTGHTSLDFSLLYQQQVNDRLTFFAELQDWMTVENNGVVTTADPAAFNGQLLNGNVLRWGVGVGYDLWQDCCNDRRLTGVFELVGWEIIDGMETSLNPALTSPDVRDANGDSIVNGKYGVRYSTRANSLYVGYGHNWSNDRWYTDIFRVELTHAF